MNLELEAMRFRVEHGLRVQQAEQFGYLLKSLSTNARVSTTPAPRARKGHRWLRLWGSEGDASAASMVTTVRAVE